MTGILIVDGGEEFAREVYQSEGRAYMSCGLSAVLEKHGFLGVEQCGPEVLSDGATLRSKSAVLVARLPDSAWTDEVITNLLSGVQVLIEGPLPSNVLRPLAVVGYESRRSDGQLRVVNPELEVLGEAYGLGIGGHLSIDRTVRFDHRPLNRNWALHPTPPFTLRQAAAWAVPSWDWAPWRLREGPSMSELLVEWADVRRGVFPGVIRRHGVLACCFGLFAAIVERHTAPPFWAETTQGSEGRGELEGLLLGLIDLMHRSGGKTRPRLRPWPAGINWVRGVRHDFDRPQVAEDITPVLDLHRRLGTVATWYWRSAHVKSDAIRAVVADGRHEVALHSQDVWFDGEREREAVEEALDFPVRGVTSHGGHESFRFQGAANVLWAEEHGFEYTELPSSRHMHPFRFVALGDDGTVTPTSVLCLPRHVSLDRSTRPGDVQLDVIAKELPRWIQAQGYLQIMNHPDINRDELEEALTATDRPGRADWTASSVMDWWRRTHDSRALKSRLRDEGRTVELHSKLGFDQAVIEFLAPNGDVTLKVVDVPLDRRVLVNADAKMEPPSWKAVEEEFRNLAIRYYETAGRDLSSRAVTSTLRSNTELVPGRSATLHRLVESLIGHEQMLVDQRVLEVGSGFGALATHYVVVDGAAEVTGIDVRSDFIGAAQDLAAQLGLGHRLRFQVADMRDLRQFEDGSFDVVIANNSLYYVPERRGVRTAIREFKRVLSPNGIAVVYQGNRWRWTDAFTKDPLVHLLPEPIAKAIARLTGWRHSHGRVEFISPLDLRLRFIRAGFRDVHTIGVSRGNPCGGFRGLFTGFFALVARKP